MRERDEREARTAEAALFAMLPYSVQALIPRSGPVATGTAPQPGDFFRRHIARAKPGSNRELFLRAGLAAALARAAADGAEPEEVADGG